MIFNDLEECSFLHFFGHLVGLYSKKLIFWRKNSELFLHTFS